MASSLLQTDVAAHRIFTGQRLLTALEAWAEAERERIGLWVPVVLGMGIAAWFWLPASAYWLAWIALCCSAALLVQLGPLGSGRLRTMLTGAALLLAAGCALVWAKALLFGEPPLQRPVYAVFSARVIAVEPQPALGRTRLLLQPEARGGSAGLPSRIRLNVADKDMPAGALGAGAIVSARARLMPPQLPAVPGGYDFARHAYFAGIGATGKALPPIRVIEPAAPSGMADARARLSRHILGRLEGGEGGIASALATGDAGAISTEDMDALRRSGLAHLISISGLHVSALIAGVIFLVMRVLASSPRLALTLPLMLIAAAAGAAAGIGYTLFTGAQVPTVRSCIAALLVLGGLALGREAISLRLVAAGALVVLIFWPEELLGPSFQMSFAAVTVIVALAESAWFRALFHAREEAVPFRLARNLGAVFVTGLVIELALMPIVLTHFHRAGALGAVANLVAIPLTTFVIMPAEAAALLLDLAGAGAPFWWVAGKALSLLLIVAHRVSASPFAVWGLPFFGAAPAVLMTLGGLWLVLWRTRLAYAGIAPVVAGGIMMALAPAPNLLVTGDGRHMAVRQADGSYALLRGGLGDYVRDVLAKSAGDAAPLGEGALVRTVADAPNARCSRDICSMLVKGRQRDWLVAATRTDVRIPWGALTRLCSRVDIIISDRRLPSACVPRWLKLDRARLRETGGVAVYLDAARTETVIRQGDRHPWMPRTPPRTGGTPSAMLLPSSPR